MAKECVLYDRMCNGCGECEYCDLNPLKRCDNCGKCIDDKADVREIKIDSVMTGNLHKHSDADFSGHDCDCGGHHHK